MQSLHHGFVVDPSSCANGSIKIFPSATTSSPIPIAQSTAKLKLLTERSFFSYAHIPEIRTPAPEATSHGNSNQYFNQVVRKRQQQP